MTGATIEVEDAALSNAEWCDAFCRARGVVGRFDEAAWSSAERTPPLYPDAVTLARGCSNASIVSRVDASPGCSIKDSFADLDLSGYGFQVMFAAEWLWQPQARASNASQGWSAISDGSELRRWETAWGESPLPRPFFRRELLGDDRVRILARLAGGLLRAGAVANRSRNVIALTNVFDFERDLESAWSGAASIAQALLGGLPVVGYDRGESLDGAHLAGFETIGSLAVWGAGSIS
jgi:hypothetical protein